MRWLWPRLATAARIPVAAQRQLAELLARPETLLPVERLLATVQLKEVEQRLILQARKNARMRDAVPNDSRDKLQAINRRLAAESDENAKLRKALDEARAKLEAVTHIEQRSVTDRGSGAPTRHNRTRRYCPERLFHCRPPPRCRSA